MIIRLVDADSGSTAEVSTFGARVLSWQCQGRERIFMPDIGKDDPRAAPHGGVPVLFPQFGFFGSGRKHGVVRDIDWAVEKQADDFVLMHCRFDNPEASSKAEVRLRVELERDALAMYFSVINASNTAMRFTCGLHTYLRVEDVSQVRVTGLEQSAWQDALNGLQSVAAAKQALEGPVNVDRVYVGTPEKLTLAEALSGVSIEQTGFADTVVWNPGPELALGLSDLGDEEWRNFLCIEAAQISPPVELPAWDTWYGRQRLQIRDI